MSTVRALSPGQAVRSAGLRGPAGRWGPPLTMAAGGVALLILFDVPGADLLRFLAYEAGFVAIPGILAYMAVCGSRRVGLREVALGWGLGYALEAGAFMATAAAGARGLFWAYPPLVVGIAAAVLLARRRHRPAPTIEAAGSSGWAWGLAVLVLVLFVYVAEGYFAANPLPWDVNGPLSYNQDYVWQMSLAAEALHHWPLQLPNVVGVGLHYHFFAYLHMAAMAQVTHVDLALVNLRLWVLPVVALACLQLVVLTRSLGAGSWTGVVAGALVFLVGPFDPWPRPPSEFFTHIFQSASYGYALILFLPLTILVVEQLGSQRRLGDGRRWALLAVFAAACTGAKSPILPTVAAALGLFALGALWLERRRPWGQRELLFRVVIAGAIVGAFALLAKAVIYTGTSGNLEFHPFRVVEARNPAALLDLKLHASGPVKWAVVGGSAVLETLKLLAPLAVGLWVVIRAPDRRRRAESLFLLLLLGVSLVGFYCLVQPGDSQAFFLYFGYVSAGALAAVGLRLLWVRYLGPIQPRPVWMAGLCAIVLAVWATDGPPGAREGEPTTPVFYRFFLGEPTWSQANSNLTPDLYRGMRWIARHTPKSSVLAVSNRWQDPGFDARYCYYTAFAERRVMLECEYGSYHPGEFATLPELQANPAAGAFGARARLNQRMFYDGDPAAAREAARRYGVTYAVLDLVHPLGASEAAARRLGRVVYRNPALVVVKLPRA